MSIYDLLNAAFSKNGYVPQSAPLRAGEVPKNPNHGQQKVPSFGVKLRAPLEKDTFQHSEKAGQPMVSYKGKTMTLEQARTKSFQEVDAHEQAHLSAAGQYAASGKVIDFDGNGIAVSGHVNIKMPHLDKSNPDETIKHAKTVMTAAKAPESFSELSDADLNVYAQASETLAKAEAFKAQQGNNPFAKDKNPFATNPFANRA